MRVDTLMLLLLHSAVFQSLGIGFIAVSGEMRQFWRDRTESEIAQLIADGKHPAKTGTDPWKPPPRVIDSVRPVIVLVPLRTPRTKHVILMRNVSDAHWKLLGIQLPGMSSPRSVWPVESIPECLYSLF